ncbi:MAG: hypothetical protein H6815_13950 [Phycisphaeraceae bacterium]|nr:hypothetical protein [Phycisphaerales bacterium]MCB9861542.1 hypothetical protein [Phycisphaeraceae bacterium]
MGQSIKSLCLVIAILSLPVVALSLATNQPTALTWSVRIASILVCSVSILLLSYLMLRRDKVPDYLRRIDRAYYNCRGLCFAVASHNASGIGCIDIYYQNMHENPCFGQIALRLTPSLIGGRWIPEPIHAMFVCDPAAYGLVRVPIAIPEKKQGRVQYFDVGAEVEYPNGRGALLRFRNGRLMRTNTNFSNPTKQSLGFLGLFVLSPLLALMARSDRVKVTLPESVTSTLPDHVQQESLTIWKLGDPPLQTQ